jgi:hypothetical protein
MVKKIDEAAMYILYCKKKQHVNLLDQLHMKEWFLVQLGKL